MMMGRVFFCTCSCLFGLALVGCAASGPPNAVPWHTSAAGDVSGPAVLGTDAGTDSPVIDVQSVANLSEEEEQTARRAITRHLERSHPDHYPQLESLHVVPGLQPETYVFIANVKVSGFTSYRYRMIGQYDRAKRQITVLEHKRGSWGPLAPATDSLCPPGTATDTPLRLAEER